MSMEQITDEMAEWICDKVCKYPATVSDQGELDAICGNCPMGKFVCDILNLYEGK